jgi:hypothetical protein
MFSFRSNERKLRFEVERSKAFPGQMMDAIGSYRSAQSIETGGPGAAFSHHFPRCHPEPAESGARKPCPGGGDLLLGRPVLHTEVELGRELSHNLGDRTLAAKLKYDRVERVLCLPGKLERECGCPAARLAMEQRAVRILRKRGEQHLKSLGAPTKS